MEPREVDPKVTQRLDLADKDWSSSYKYVEGPKRKIWS